MPNEGTNYRTITSSELPSLLERYRFQQRRSLALISDTHVSGYRHADWISNDGDWTSADIYLLHEPISSEQIFYLTAIESLQQLAIISSNLGDEDVHIIVDKLPKLIHLNLDHNNVSDVGARAIAKKLSQLQALHLSNNKVGALGAEAIAHNLMHLCMLDLNSQKIGDVGAIAIADNLIRLHTLLLGGGKISEIGVRAIAEKLVNLKILRLDNSNADAACISAITNKLLKLEVLNLSGSQIGDRGACSIAHKLINIHSLYLKGCSIGEFGLSAIAAKLIRLRNLDISQNDATDKSVRQLVHGLPLLETLRLFGNSALLLPKELTGHETNVAALRDYFRRLDGEQKRKLNEAKLIVIGNEAAGKTSLVNYLIHGRPCSDTKKTPGLQINDRIEVSRWKTGPGVNDPDPLHVNVWDFGGQEVTRETHKLFLTARTLYLLVVEARREDALATEMEIHKWMRAILHRGREPVPVIVVVNKSEGDQQLQLDEATLCKTYSIRAFIRTSCLDPKEHPDGGKGIKVLGNAIVETIRREIPHASDVFPVSYFDVMQQLRETAKAEYSLGVVRYTNICRGVEHAVVSEDEQGRLLQTLVNIGIVIQHKDTTLLDPNWLTRAIYRILTHSEVVKSAGLFRMHELGKLLADIQRPENEPGIDIRYPEDRWRYIVDQTVECGLSFEIADEPGTYLMPEQLPPNAVETGLDQLSDPEVLRFRYDYDDVPKGLVPRFIVQMHRYLPRHRTCWANGVVLHIGVCRVLAVSDRRARRLNLFVHGPAAERREALRVVLEGLAVVHGWFEDLGESAMVPVPIPGKPDAAIPHRQLIEFERAGPQFDQFPHEGSIFSVRELLGSIVTVPARVPPQNRHSFDSTNLVDETRCQLPDKEPLPVIERSPTPIQSVATERTWLAPVLAAAFVTVLLGMYFASASAMWLAMVAGPTLAGVGVYLVRAYYADARQHWARRNAGICLGLVGMFALVPGINFLVQPQSGSLLKLVVDNSTWPAGVAFIAAGYFGWLQRQRDREDAGR